MRDMKSCIIATYEFPKKWKPNSCWHIPSKGPIPRTLKETGTKRILHRKILDVENHLGAYGWEFFGLKLEKTKKYPVEWLVLRLRNADNWLHFNDVPIDCHTDQKHKISTCGIKYMRAKFPDSFIDKAVINLKSCKFEIETERYFDPNHRFNLEIKENPKTRPVYAHNGGLREFAPKDYVEDAWIISKTQWLAI